MVRAAIVGLGRWGRSLVTSVQGKSDDIRFVAGHTRTRAAAEEFCRDKGVRLVDSFGQILSDREVDAVVLATPHTQHEAQIKDAAAAGKHIFVEKPIALDRASAQAAYDAARKAGIVFAVGFGRRFHPAINELRTRVKDGRLGTIVAMVGQHTTSTAQFIPQDNWRADPKESPAGALTAVGVHLLDHMIELAGPIREVQCVTARYAAGPADDTTTMLLRFATGATGTIFCSVSTATDFQFTTYGTKGLVEISQPQLQRFRFAAGADRPPTGLVAAPPDEIIEYPGFDVLNAELVAFARCIKERRTYPVPIDELLHAMSVFDALVESARTNRPVAVSGAA